MKINSRIIGISGVARAGKDTCANLIKKSEIFAGKKVKTLAFADELKLNAGFFLKNFCNVEDVTKLAGEQKKDVRPFLVWYGCYMRKQDPEYWVKNVAQKIFTDDETDVFIVTDLRFENEVKWVQGLKGKVIHVKRYQPEPYQTSLVPPANEEEERNDPIVDELSNVHVRWPTVTDDKLDSLQSYVDEAIKRI